MHQDVDKLLADLEYQFNSIDLLTDALTHRSYHSVRRTYYSNNKAPSADTQVPVNNERLEFLGDAALGYLVAEILYAEYPEASEHDLTLMRANLVRGTSLAELARGLKLGKYLFLGQGERRNGGADRDSILADGLEALLGAVLLDGGVVALRTVVIRLFRNRLEKLVQASMQDSKSRLQEAMQARGMPLPSYQIVETSGKQHAQTFTVKCSVDELGLSAQAQAGNRKSAEKLAAEQILMLMEPNSRV